MTITYLMMMMMMMMMSCLDDPMGAEVAKQSNSGQPVGDINVEACEGLLKCVLEAFLLPTN